MTSAAYTDRTTARNYLATLRPVDGTGAVAVVRVGKYGFTTEPTDTPPNAQFRGWLADGPILERGIDGNALGGIADASNGSLTIQLHDGNDWLLDLHYAGHAVEIRFGLFGRPWRETEPLLTGVMGQPAVHNSQLVVPILSRLRLLEKRFQDELFTGTGDWQGDSNLAGKTLPALYGWGDNLSPRLVDGPDRRYVFHDGSAQAIDAAYSGGNSIGGAYTGDAANGRITPSSPQVSLPFTIDARGDSTGGFVDSGPLIIRRMIEQRSSITTAEIDTPAFAALDADAIAGERIGYYLPAGDTRELVDAVAEIAQTFGGFVGERIADGRITVIRLDLPTGNPVLSLTPEDLVGGRVEIVRIDEPVWQVTGTYGVNWTPLGRQQMASALLGTAVETYFAEASRAATPAEDTDVLVLYPEAAAAQPVRLLFKDKSAADAELARRLAIRSQRLVTYEVETMTLAHGLEIGAEVRLTHPRYGLSGGRDLVLRHIRIRPGDRATLRLWGPG